MPTFDGQGPPARRSKRIGVLSRTRARWTVAILAVTPFVGICLSVALWDRIEPMILGLPFNFFWLIAWTVLTSACLAAAYRVGGYGARSREETRRS